MTCIDPSGYFGKWLAKKWREEVWRSPIGRAVLAIAVSYLTYGIASEYLAFSLQAGQAATVYGASAVSGFAGGAISGGTLKSGLQGAFTAVLFAGVGSFIEGDSAFKNGSRGVTNPIYEVALHGVAGCVTSEVSGGSCSSGAMSAAFSKAMVVTGVTSASDPVSGTILSAVAGGTASVLGGGKFANGAQTGAFSYLFNFLAHRKPILNPNNIGGDNAYGIDFESGIPRRELGWFARGLRGIGANIPGLGLLINGEEYTQRATCAVMAECFGSRHLSNEMRQTALGLEPEVKAMALKTSTMNGIDLNSMSRSQLEAVVNSWARIPGFKDVYGSTTDVMSHFKSFKTPQ